MNFYDTTRLTKLTFRIVTIQFLTIAGYIIMTATLLYKRP